MNKQFISTLAFVTIFAVPLMSHAANALLIGVSAYRQSPLANPVNDVQLVSRSLISKGWNTTVLINPTSEELKTSVRAFFSQKIDSNKPSLIYFSGHGIQYKGENYLLPIDIDTKEILLNKALSVTEIGYFARENKGPKIFVIDACRNSPLGKSSVAVSSGLNSQYAPPNTLIAYATAPGRLASDGVAGANSPYARALATSIDRYSTLSEVFKKTRLLTMDATNGKQLPWESSSLYQEVSFPHGLPGSPVKQEKLATIDVGPPSVKGRVASENALPTMPQVSYGSFEAAIAELTTLVRNSPLSSFEDRMSRPITERNRRDLLETLQSYSKRLSINSDGIAYSVISALQDGVLYPACRSGQSIDPDCGDYDRFFSFTPNLVLSFGLSKIAHDENIRSDRLALHYMNGWGVEKDLVRAYDLFKSDKVKKGRVADYWWTNVNTMVQEELRGHGFEIAADGAFGPSTCKALKELIGETTCDKVATRSQVIALAAKTRIQIR